MSYSHGKHHKKAGFLFSQQVLTKRDISVSLWTKFGLCGTELEIAENGTDVEVTRKQVI